MADTRRRVLVTGGGRGLGTAIVRAIAAAGDDVTFTYRSAAAEADALVKELTAAHPRQTFAAHQAAHQADAALDALGCGRLDAIAKAGLQHARVDQRIVQRAIGHRAFEAALQDRDHHDFEIGEMPGDDHRAPSAS